MQGAVLARWGTQGVVDYCGRLSTEGIHARLPRGSGSLGLSCGPNLDRGVPTRPLDRWVGVVVRVPSGESVHVYTAVCVCVCLCVCAYVYVCVRCGACGAGGSACAHAHAAAARRPRPAAPKRTRMPHIIQLQLYTHMSHVHVTSHIRE